ncbi:uroporphyrinogen-III synthase [Alkalicoccobacillus murimartini]|uniref:Uroporphyrinogen-III synthase n=1 Tax=Alkalicoccobacillus murimartini TaxID=171685 RepID=A0ABT9YKA6_9BACI|nr:uroporphyrinogen-III synthase [Alkalicoccobacillus murimartini]MDQ0208018.1 uroporphyrinogen-III synthase [Alkalicoccobacillus murimartini]
MTHNSLHGATVLVTRAAHQATRFVEQIEQAGGVAVEVPLIHVKKATNQKRIQHVIATLKSYKWVVFTSANGVRFFLDQLTDVELRQLRLSASIATVGSSTAKVLTQYGLVSKLMPKKYEAQSLAEELLQQTSKDDSILLARGNLARPILAQTLEQAGRKITDVPVYETYFSTDSKEAIKALQDQGTRLDFLTFTSPSTVSRYVEIAKQLTGKVDLLFPKANVVCIGTVTAEEARRNGLSVAAVPRTFTTEAMVEELVRLKRRDLV